MGMKIATLAFIFLCCSPSIYADTLPPSTIEVLRQEFENLNSYQSPPSYLTPPENTQSPHQPAASSQFVDLDGVFGDESVNSVKRKRQ